MGVFRLFGFRVEIRPGFLVFLVLVHVRLKAKDKGMWTAWLAIIGAAVMLFNWIVINFVITGLHSYA